MKLHHEVRSRRIRSDAQIGNVRTLKAKAPDLITRLGPRITVGTLREIFGRRSVTEIAEMPREQRAVFVESYFRDQGLPNSAARAALTAALFGALGDRVLSGAAYYVQIGGQKYDRKILQAFLRAVADEKNPVVSANDAKESIVPAIADARVVTPVETESYLFCLQHFKTTGKATREQLVPMLRALTGDPVKVIENGAQGFDFGELYDHLQQSGRLSDLYSAKADMTREDMIRMWDHGISLEALNAHLKTALEPKTEAELGEKFGRDQFDQVVAWLREQGNEAALQRLSNGEVSPGEFQNLIYGSWKIAGTPYDPDYRAKYRPFPVTPRAARPAAAGDLN